MISVEAATQIVTEQIWTPRREEVSLARASGRVLREDLIADRDFPPFNRVAMDGIAIQQVTFAAGQRQFAIGGMAQAGAEQCRLSDPAKCLEVMTGAVLPDGADAVVRYEDISIENGVATILLEEIKAGQHIHRQGADRLSGEVIVPAGRLISGAEIGVAATVGKHRLQVDCLPSVVIAVTGDELVAVEGPAPLPHQIRQSNNYALQALLQQWGIEASIMHLPDDEAIIRTRLQALLGQYDVIMLSGGVSKGKLDFLPASLQAVGVRQLFHRIAQRPGQPFWFGVSDQGPNVVFAFPGNPVSSFMCANRYFLPWLRAWRGLPPLPDRYAILAEDVAFKPDLSYFLQVRIHCTPEGKMMATPLPGGGSGDLANLGDTEAFLELPKGREVYPAGEVFRYWNFR